MLNTARLPRAVLWLAAGLITCLIGLHFRLYPLFHNVSSDAYEQGTLLVISKVRAGVAAQIEHQFPDLPPMKKEMLIKEQFDKVVRENGAQLRKAFDDAGQQLSEKSGDNKHYLLEIDAYYFLSLTQEILEKGSFGSGTKDGKFFNPMMLAPLGYWQPQTWHPYIGAIVYKIVHFLNPKSDLMFGVGFTAVALFPIVLAAFFFACRSLGCGIFPAFIASLYFILAPIYLQRSTFANFKDDAYNLFFPLLVLGLLFRAVDQFKNLKKMSLYILLIAVSLAIYAQFWAGWGFLWGLSLAGIAAVAVKSFIRNRPAFKPALFLAGGLAITPFIAVGIFFGFGAVVQIVLFASGELQKFIAPSMKGWPDLFIVVGELKRISLGEAIRLTGGPVMFIGGVLAMGWTGWHAFFKYDAKAARITILAVCLAATLLLALSAQRFTLLCLTPLSLLFAHGLSELWENRFSLSLRQEKFKKLLPPLLAGMLILSVTFPLVTAQTGIRSFLSPIFNSAWERALVKLRDHSPENSVINTWWSPGHFVKAIARRRVTFDGASIKGEQAYWLTRVYLSQSEEEALGILRMLNVSSNNAAEYLEHKGLPLSEIVPLITAATGLDRDRAYELYRKTLPASDAAELLKMTHGSPPPSYVMIYNEIVDGNVMLGYLGKWNFKKIEELNRDPKLLKQVPPRSSKDYVNFIWDLVGGPYRQSPTLNLKGRHDGVLLFDQGVELNTADMTVRVRSAQFGAGVPQSIFYAAGGEVKEQILAGANLPYSVVFFKESSGGMHCVLLDRVVANSLISRMYYFEGLGLKRFKPFANEKDLTGRTKILIYEVEW